MDIHIYEIGLPGNSVEYIYPGGGMEPRVANWHPRVTDDSKLTLKKARYGARHLGQIFVHMP